MPSGSSFSAGGIIEFRISETKGLRGRGGTFSSEGLNAQRLRNKELTERLQSRVADLIEHRIRWRAESTGALAHNTLSPENAAYDTWFVGVGNEDFLDSSTSKYWRTAEFGSAAVWSHPFVGTRLWGRYGGRGFGKGPLTGFWTAEEGTGLMEVRHETTPLHAYRDAQIDIPLREFAVQNLRQTLRDAFG